MTKFRSFWCKHRRIPFWSHVVLDGIMQPLMGGNSHNSVISLLILDLFGTNEHQRIPFCPMWFLMESCIEAIHLVWIFVGVLKTPRGFNHTSPDGGESPYKSMGTRFCVHIVFVTNAASKNVNEKLKTQASSPPFIGGYMMGTS